MANTPATQPKKGPDSKPSQAKPSQADEASQRIVKEFLDWTGRSGTPPNGEKRA